MSLNTGVLQQIRDYIANPENEFRMSNPRLCIVGIYEYAITGNGFRRGGHFAGDTGMTDAQQFEIEYWGSYQDVVTEDMPPCPDRDMALRYLDVMIAKGEFVEWKDTF